MRKRSWIVGLILSIAIFLGTVSVSSQVEASKTIKMVTTGVSYPGSYKNKQGQLDGFDVQVAKAAAKKLGYKIQWTTTSFDGLFGQLTSGKVDAIASNITITPEREKTYYFSSPYAYFKTGVVVQKDSSLKNVKELGSKTTLAATVGSIQIQQIPKYNSSIKVRTFDDREQALNAVVNGQTDGYANSTTILKSAIVGNKLPLRILKGSIDTTKIGLTFDKNSQGKKYQKQFTKAVNELQKDGTISKLSKKYFDGIDASK